MTICGLDRRQLSYKDLRDKLLPEGVLESDTLHGRDWWKPGENEWDSEIYHAIIYLEENDLPMHALRNWEMDFDESTTFQDVLQAIHYHLTVFYNKMNQWREMEAGDAVMDFLKYLRPPRLMGLVLKNTGGDELDYAALDQAIQQDHAVNGVLRIREMVADWFMNVHGLGLEWVTEVQQRMLRAGEAGIEWSDAEYADFLAGVYAVENMADMVALIDKIRYKAGDPENRRLA